MFSKGVVLIFLILGLSSSIAHAIPYQNRAENPCADPSVVSQNHTTSKGTDKSTTKQDTGKTALGKGANTTLTSNNNTGANPQGNDSHGNGKTSTSVNDNGKTAKPQATGATLVKGAKPQVSGTTPAKDANPQASGTKPAKDANPQATGASLGANPQDNGKNNNTTGNTGNNDPNTSQCLDQSVLSKGSESDGLNNATAGTSASLTSTNNFINFCTGKTITSGQQVKDGSCNPIPMGQIASTANIPSCKYVSPKNLDTLKANTAFTMQLAVKNVQLGVFTNAETNYYSAPQQVNNQGQIIGHTHMVVEQVQSLTSTDPLDATKFAFFKGIDNAAAADGTVSADVTGGLPAGVYRFMTIGTSANHAPFLVAVAQHGSMEDAIYATVTADGNPDNGNNGNGNSTASGSNSTATGTGGQTAGGNSTASGSNSTTTGTGGQTAGGNSTASGSNSTTTGTGGQTAGGNKNTTSGNTNTGKGGKGKNGANGKTPRQNKRRTFSLEYQKD